MVKATQSPGLWQSFHVYYGLQLLPPPSLPEFHIHVLILIAPKELHFVHHKVPGYGVGHYQAH